MHESRSNSLRPSISPDRQTLWSIYAGPSAYAEIAMIGDRLQFLLKSATKEDVTEVDAAPGTVLIEASISPGSMRIDVNGVTGPKRSTTLSFGTGTQFLGSLAGQNPANGAIRNLKIYDTTSTRIN